MYNQSELKEIVDQTLVNLSYNTEAGKLIDPVKYILSLGGKRIRPVMALMACNLFCDNISDAILPAAGLEVFHNFTLVHDDIMDQASVRRGFSTVHHKWDTNQAILSGDVMAFIANDCFLQTPGKNLLRVFMVFNKAAIEVCVGQQLDMNYEKAAVVTQDEYLRMIEMKTAALMAASFRIGTMIGGGNDKDSDLLFEFGRNLGLAFQIQDDLLDIWGDTKIFGKKAGGDIVTDKKTFPLIKALELASGDSKKQLQSLYNNKDLDPEIKIKQVISIYDELNIREVTETLANDFFDKAFSLLQKVGVDDNRKKELTDLASSLIGRNR